MTNSPSHILTINCGSSSIKFALFQIDVSLCQIFKASIDRTEGTENIEALMNALRLKEIPGLSAIGHRFVHGGPLYNAPQLITEKMILDLKKIRQFDPEHLPEEIAIYEAFTKKFSDLPQVACFDTAFHHDLPRVAQLLAIPKRFEAQGVKRYGFHGISYSYLTEELSRLEKQKLSQGKVIFCHLGNGSSLAAVENAKPIDTSMSFTPSSGVLMGTRSGDIDPGLIWYLSETTKMSTNQINEMLNFQSGLLGISETSSNMRELLNIEITDQRASEAIALYCYQIKKCIGAYAASLGGLDTLVFSGGIGENSPTIRARICAGLEFLGIELNEKLNDTNNAVISEPTSKITLRIINTDEEFMIAKFTSKVLKAPNGNKTTNS